MDLVRILRSRVDELPSGSHISGLRAILQHVEVAVRHLERGQRSHDDTAFTDAIYRTNQAFEGSLKEAYRVLTGNDPARSRPYDIEAYFQQNASLRPRVLNQLTTYRTDWRNPSTHDYRLDFNEDEALLAIVSVCAFAIVLIDQISEKLAFDAVRETSVATPRSSRSGPFLQRIAQALKHFPTTWSEGTRSSKSDVREAELVGAIAGFLSTNFPEVFIPPDGNVAQRGMIEPDLIVANADDKVLIEVKRVGATPERIESAIDQVSRYMAKAGLKHAVVYFHPVGGVPRMIVEGPGTHPEGGEILVVAPQGHIGIG